MNKRTKQHVDKQTYLLVELPERPPDNLGDDPLLLPDHLLQVNVLVLVPALVEILQRRTSLGRQSQLVPQAVPVGGGGGGDGDRAGGGLELGGGGVLVVVVGGGGVGAVDDGDGGGDRLGVVGERVAAVAVGNLEFSALIEGLIRIKCLNFLPGIRLAR